MQVPRLLAKEAAAKAYEQEAEDYPADAMAWMHHAAWMGPVKVPLDHIDPEMPWMDPEDPDHVQDFVKLIKDGKKLKPVVLVKTPKGGKLKLVDGQIRRVDEPALPLPLVAADTLFPTVPHFGYGDSLEWRFVEGELSRARLHVGA